MKFIKAQLLNNLIIEGKKHLCENIFLKTTKLTQKHYIKSSKSLLQSAIINAAPLVQVKQIKRKRKKREREV